MIKRLWFQTSTHCGYYINGGLSENR